jgi:hypothetical protein
MTGEVDDGNDLGGGLRQDKDFCLAPNSKGGMLLHRLIEKHTALREQAFNLPSDLDRLHRPSLQV